jgi:flagellar hook-associated protein 2
LAGKLLTVALQASEGVKLPTDVAGTSKEGVLQGLIQRRNDSIKSLNTQISAWDVRLDLRKSALQKQFSNLEVAMGKMQQQSSWLASQLAGLG